MTEPRWLTIARGELDVAEVPGPKHNPRILEYHAAAGGASEDEVSWCSSFVAWCMLEAGIVGTGSPVARSWLGWGVALAEPRTGCVVVIRRGTAAWQGHVGFYVGTKADRLTILAGNHSDRVSVMSFPAGKLLGFRWPSAAALDVAGLDHDGVPSTTPCCCQPPDPRSWKLRDGTWAFRCAKCRRLIQS